jgi:hypothetical protein
MNALLLRISMVPTQSTKRLLEAGWHGHAGVAQVPLSRVENGEHAIHKPLVSPETVAEVPLTGRSLERGGASRGGDYWLIAEVSSWLDPAHTFRPESDLYSDSGRFRLTLQRDGNLVLYDEGGVSMASATAV